LAGSNRLWRGDPWAGWTYPAGAVAGAAFKKWKPGRKLGRLGRRRRLLEGSGPLCRPGYRGGAFGVDFLRDPLVLLQIPVSGGTVDYAVVPHFLRTRQEDKRSASGMNGRSHSIWPNSLVPSGDDLLTRRKCPPPQTPRPPRFCGPGRPGYRPGRAVGPPCPWAMVST
jgi:hypothetical protein